jgi:hypothetical protein
MNMAKKTTNNNSKYCEDWVPVQGINNGMIILDNNLKVLRRANNLLSRSRRF